MSRSITLVLLLLAAVGSSLAAPQHNLPGDVGCPTQQTDAGAAEDSDPATPSADHEPSAGSAGKAGHTGPVPTPPRVRWHSLVPGMLK